VPFDFVQTALRRCQTHRRLEKPEEAKTFVEAATVQLISCRFDGIILIGIQEEAALTRTLFVARETGRFAMTDLAKAF
jgi:hypothetical protein